MNETDKAVSGILQDLQEVTPEVAAQAVAYWRMVDAIWLGILGTVVLICTVLTLWALRMGKMRSYNRDGYDTTAIISGIVGALALLVGCVVAIDLVKTYVATDYYAAQCILSLAGR